MDEERHTSVSDRSRGDELPSRREVLRILFRHKKKMATFFMAAVVTTLVATSLITPTYESNAKLLMRVGRESVAMDPSVLGPTLNVAQDRANEINSEIGILTSAYLVGRVIDELGAGEYLGVDEAAPDAVARQREAAVGHFIGSLSAAAESDSNIINLTFRARTPGLAQRALSSLIELHLDRHIELYRTQASPAFFRERSARLLERLTESEDELESFRNENRIASIEAQKQALITQISSLETALNDVTGQVDSSEARIGALQLSLDSRPDTNELSRVTGIINPAADQIKSRLIDLRLEEADLAARYPDEERALVDVREQIEVALAELAREEETRTQITVGIDRNFEALQLELMTEQSRLYAAIARLRSLNEELEIKRAELTRLARDEIQLARLERAVDIADQEYREYIAHHQRADISAALDSDRVSNVSVVQPASYSSGPVAPRRFLNFVLSVFIGLFGGIGLAYLAELLDDTLKTRGDVGSKLGLPVLATLTAEEYQSCT